MNCMDNPVIYVLSRSYDPKKVKIWCEHHTTFLILLNDAYLSVLLPYFLQYLYPFSRYS
jgi:hypothetical protein